MRSTSLRPLRPGVSESFPYPTRRTRAEPRLAYFDTGGRGPCLLLVHGLGANFTHFELIAPALARSHRVIGVDLPGCGDSDKPAVRYTLDLYVDAVLRLLDELGIDEATLLGHSLGGLVVATVALRAPERVTRLVLMSSAGFRRYPAALALAARLLVPSVVARAMEHLAPRLLASCFGEENAHTRRFMGQAVGRPAHPTVDEFAATNCSLLPDLARRHLVDDLARLTAPTLVLWGSRDRLLPLRDVPAGVARMPAARLVVLDGCGHMPLIERPEETVAAIRRFLDETVTVREAAALAPARGSTSSSAAPSSATA